MLRWRAPVGWDIVQKLAMLGKRAVEIHFVFNLQNVDKQTARRPQVTRDNHE